MRMRAPLTGAAADRAAARFLDGDRPRRRVVDGSLLSRTDPAPWREWLEVGAFLDAPHARSAGCDDDGCAAMRGAAPSATTGAGIGGQPGSAGASAPLAVGSPSQGGKGAPETLPADAGVDLPDAEPLWTVPEPVPERPDLPFEPTPDGDPCAHGVGAYLTPPAWSLSAQVPALYTQICFALQYGFAGWPAHACGAPCVVPQPCAVPTAAEANGALATLAADDPSDPALVVVNAGTSPQPAGWQLLGRALTPNEVQALGGALFLLQSNIDLVEWAVCLACTWSPNILDEDVDTVVQAVVDGIMGLDGRRIYLINQFPASPGGGSPTGGASDLVTSQCCWMGIVGQDGAMQDGRTGVILPIGLRVFQNAIAAAVNAAGNLSACGQVCALSFIAETILHELVHLCAETPILGGCTTSPGGLLVACASPGAADDRYDCWAVQNMSSVSFMWAMGQRFSGLAGLACCPKTADTYFMTSEPDGATRPDGTSGFNAFEPFPWSAVPC